MRFGQHVVASAWCAETEFRDSMPIYRSSHGLGPPLAYSCEEMDLREHGGVRYLRLLAVSQRQQD